MNSLWRSVTAAIATLAFGCASTHNLRTDGFNPLGGGFTEKELRPGLYEMMATSNFAPWANLGAAQATWKARADQLCGKEAYEEFFISASATERGQRITFIMGRHAIGPFLYVNTTITGYLLCKSSDITLEEAVKYVGDSIEAAAKDISDSLERELNELGGADCAKRAADISSDTYFRRGKVLVGLNRYESAMQCLLRVQDGEERTPVYRESCSLIGTMYELGWGVEQNVEVAVEWYKKAAR
jgi:TPR repeat protein